jgi:hypothetical protein
MPYTKEQLKNNEHYERVLEATRREQVSTFVKDERDLVASGSAANTTLRIKTGEFVSIPEIENDPTQKVVIPNTTYFVTEDADKFVDKDIKELLNNDPVQTLTVGEFFKEYEKLKDTISGEGSGDSHRYLYEQALIYLNAGDELALMKAELQSEIDNLKELQLELTVELEEDAKYDEYVAKMLMFQNTTKPYTEAEWKDKGKPVAAETAGWSALRFVRQPLGNHKGKDHTQEHVKVTYYGRWKKKNRKLRKGNGPVVFSVEAVGDPTLKYEWIDAATGRSVLYHDKADRFKGIDTNTLTIEQAGRYKNGFGPVLQCKISDSTGEKISANCEISRRSVNAGS